MREKNSSIIIRYIFCIDIPNFNICQKVTMKYNYLYWSDLLLSQCINYDNSIFLNNTRWKNDLSQVCEYYFEILSLNIDNVLYQ